MLLTNKIKIPCLASHKIFANISKNASLQIIIPKYLRTPLVSSNICKITHPKIKISNYLSTSRAFPCIYIKSLSKYKIPKYLDNPKYLLVFVKCFSKSKIEIPRYFSTPKVSTNIYKNGHPKIKYQSTLVPLKYILAFI